MIRYTLTCDQGHQFDSWFASADAFDTLQAASMVECTICGSKEVRKSVMAPRIGKTRPAPTPPAAALSTPLSTPANEAEVAIKALREKVEATSEDVGSNFASEARKIHEGEAPERSIYGEAKLQDAKALIEDGVPVMPLPFTPTRKTN